MSPSEGLCGCCFASPTHPPPPSYSPGEGDVGLCPAPCWSSWGGSHAGHPGGVPSLRTGDAEHCSHVRSGQWKDMARKVLSSPPFSPPPPPLFFFSILSQLWLEAVGSPSPRAEFPEDGSARAGRPRHAALCISTAGTAGPALQRGSGCSHHLHLVWGTLPAPWRGTTRAALHINQPRLNFATAHLPDPAISLLFPWDSSANASGPWAVQPLAPAGLGPRGLPGLMRDLPPAARLTHPG